MPAGRIRVAVRQGDGEAVEGERFVPAVSELVLDVDGAPVEVRRFGVAAQLVVGLTGAVPGQGLTATVAETPVEGG